MEAMREGQQVLDDGWWFDVNSAEKWDGNHERLYRARGSWILHKERWHRINANEAHAWLQKNGHEAACVEHALAPEEI